MARPNKQGLDYFPLDVYVDDKIKFIKARFKWEGYGILIGIFQHIYSQGYWCSWNEDDAFLYSDENKINIDLLNNIIDEALKRGLFCAQLYEKYKILTSRGIQKRYIEIIKRRLNVDIMQEYVLINGAWGKQNADKMSTPCKQDASKSTQIEIESKEKEKVKRKGKKKKTYLEDSIEFQVAEFLYHNILKYKPDYKQPNLQKWADDARKLLEERNLETIKKLIVWVCNDDFERSNVLSIAKLRERFDPLEIKMNTKKPTGQLAKRPKRSIREILEATLNEDGTINEEEIRA